MLTVTLYFGRDIGPSGHGLLVMHDIFVIDAFLSYLLLVVYVFTWPFYPFITDISPPELRGFDNRSHRPDDALILSRTMHALLLVSSRHYRQRMEAKGYFFLNGWKQKDLDCKFP